MRSPTKIAKEINDYNVYKRIVFLRDYNIAEDELCDFASRIDSVEHITVIIVNILSEGKYVPFPFNKKVSDILYVKFEPIYEEIVNGAGSIWIKSCCYLFKYLLQKKIDDIETAANRISEYVKEYDRDSQTKLNCVTALSLLIMNECNLSDDEKVYLKFRFNFIDIT